MKETSKCLEYYLDSKVYNYEDVEKNIEETKKDFPKKKFSYKMQMETRKKILEKKKIDD